MKDENSFKHGITGKIGLPLGGGAGCGYLGRITLFKVPTHGVRQYVVCFPDVPWGECVVL